MSEMLEKITNLTIYVEGVYLIVFCLSCYAHFE